jgi:hypothetical protein
MVNLIEYITLGAGVVVLMGLVIFNRREFQRKQSKRGAVVSAPNSPNVENVARRARENSWKRATISIKDILPEVEIKKAPKKVHVNRQIR